MTVNSYESDLSAQERILHEGSTATLRFQFVDEYGAPVSDSQVSAITMTYLNIEEETVINGRSAQNVLNTNDCTLQSYLTITGATKANPCVVTTLAAHELTTGDVVYVNAVVGMTELNDRTFIVTRLTSTTFELQGENSTGYTAYSSGGTVQTGLFRWNMQVEDTTIVDSTVADGEIDSHVMQLTWTYATKTGKKSFPIDILKEYG